MGEGAMKTTTDTHSGKHWMGLTAGVAWKETGWNTQKNLRQRRRRRRREERGHTCRSRRARLQIKSANTASHRRCHQFLPWSVLKRQTKMYTTVLPPQHHLLPWTILVSADCFFPASNKLLIQSSWKLSVLLERQREKTLYTSYMSSPQTLSLSLNWTKWFPHRVRLLLIIPSDVCLVTR